MRPKVCRILNMGNFIFHNLFFIYGSMRAIGAENITILYFSSSSKKRAHGKEGGLASG